MAAATSNDFLNEPVQDQHDQPVEDKVAGIFSQEASDLAGHDEPVVLEALRQRFADAGIPIDDDRLIEEARRISGLDPTSFSEGGVVPG